MPKKTLDPKHKAVHIARIILYVTVTFASLTFLAYFFRFSFWFELFVTYTPQLIFVYVGVLILCTTLWVLKADEDGWQKMFNLHKSVPIMLVALIVLTASSFYLSIYEPKFARQTDSENTRTLKVMTYNKIFNNTLDSHSLNYISNQDPDILAFQEIFKAEAQEIAEQLGYTHWHIASCGCSAFGSDLALFSKFPITEVDIAFEDKLGGFLRGEIELGHQDNVVVYVAHVAPPYSHSDYNIRPEMFDDLEALINSETDPVFLMGDFNSTLFSIDMRSLASNIENKSLPIGEQPWPKCSWFGFGDLLCARIDHIFIPVDSYILDQYIGPSLSSDHRPVGAVVSI